MNESLTSPIAPEAAAAPQRRCANCGATPGTRFCGECGQPSRTGPLTFGGIVREYFTGALNLDRGFLFTLRQMTVRPAAAIDEYLGGRTVPYTSPQKYLILTGVATTLLLLLLGARGDLSEAATAGLGAEASMQAERAVQLLVALVADHYNLLILASIPFVTAASWLLFACARRTFAEHLVFNTYTVAHQSLLFTTLALALLAGVSTTTLQPISLLLITGYWVWAAVGFFRLPWASGLLRAVGATLLSTFFYWMAVVGALVTYLRLA